MRIAAGIILMVLGMVGLVGLVLGLSHSSIDLSIVPWRIISGGFLVTGGVYCLKRRYWRLCLASALLALLIGISSAIFSVVGASLYGPVPPTWVFMVWGTWVMLAGAAISTIFIYRTKKQWQKSETSPELHGGQNSQGQA